MSAVAPVVLDRDRIRLADRVLVYLERAVTTSGPIREDSLPRPHGVAPLARGADGVVLASVGPEEGVWLGFQPVDLRTPAVLRIRVDRPEPVDAVTGEPWDEVDDPRSHVVCPPQSGLAGPRVTGGRQLFGSAGVERFTLLLLDPAGSEVTVQLVLPATFVQVTGRLPPPLDPGSAYTGRRLP